MSRASELIDASFRALLAGNEGAAERYLADLQSMLSIPPTCVSKSGACPVNGCDEEGECYLWRCEHPDAPEKETT